MNLSGISELLSEIFLGKITKTDEKKLADSRKRFDEIFKENSEERNDLDTETIKKYLENVHEHGETIKKIQTKEANKYIKDIPQFLEKLKTAIKHLIFTYSKLSETLPSLTPLRDNKTLKNEITYKIKPYLLCLEERTPKAYEEIQKFIDESIKNKDEIAKQEQSDFSPVPEINYTIASGKIEPLSTMFSGKAINALARIKTSGHYDPLERKLAVEGVNIFSPESVQKIGVGTAKIFRYAVAEFTKRNAQNAKGDKINPRIFLDVKDFATANGVDIDSTDAMKNFRRKLRNSLNILLQSSITLTEKIKGKEQTFSGLNYIGAYELKPSALEVEFTLKMAEYLTSLPLIKYPRSLYIIDDRDANAYAIGEAMCIHYSQDNNVMKQTEGKLSVEKLLEKTSLPTREEIKKQRLSWYERVKEPLENILERLKQCGFLKDYRYCYSGGKEITDKEMRAGTRITDSYENFISLLVKFELNNYENSQIRAIEIKKKKAEKIKKLQAKRKTKKKADNN